MASSNCVSPDELNSSSSTSSEDELAMDFDISQIQGYAKEPEVCWSDYHINVAQRINNVLL